jgi:hypothetical protein
VLLYVGRGLCDWLITLQRSSTESLNRLKKSPCEAPTGPLKGLKKLSCELLFKFCLPKLPLKSSNFYFQFPVGKLEVISQCLRYRLSKREQLLVILHASKIETLRSGIIYAMFSFLTRHVTAG